MQKPISRAAFMQRMLRHGGYTALVVVVSIAGGMIGYHEIVGLPWVDSFLDTCMLLGGMGPVFTNFQDNGSRIFAGLFALYSGLLFLLTAALLLTPVFHRVLHRFHWEESRGKHGES